jgi:NlpC/P60 family putative phage cell wall peptidase
VKRAEIVAATREWVGTPYRHQTATRGAGCDCLGLLRGVWRHLYGDEPMVVPNYRADWRDGRHAGELQAAADELLILAEGEPRPGQVLLFRLGRTATPRHCGIVVEPRRFIHAQEGLGVIEANLTDGWAKRAACQYDFPGVTD